MKKYFAIIMVVMLVLLSSCGTLDSTTENTTESLSETEAAKKQYSGNYKNEKVYQELMQIENCNDPNRLCELLFDLYGENFTYVEMKYITYDNGTKGYATPYEEFLCQAIALYNTQSNKHHAPITTDTYIFFRENDESPSFMMAADASYIVDSYEILNFDDGTHCHKVDAWVISDLFMCLHEFLDTDAETIAYFRDAVRYMDFYLDFENLIIGKLGENSGSIDKTDSLNPSIDILSVDIVGPSFCEMEVKYRINNISEKRGVVHLTCSGHAYQDDLHFNDENFEDDTREDGTYTYRVLYAGNGTPVTFTIYYGYGNFDPYEGWDKEIRETVSILYVDPGFFAETNGVIGSNSIPENEIHPLYFEDVYVGAWTTHSSGDLMVIPK